MKVSGITANIILLVLLLLGSPLLGKTSVVNAATPSPPAASPTTIEPAAAGNEKPNKKELNLRHRRTTTGGTPVSLPTPPTAEPTGIVAGGQPTQIGGGQPVNLGGQPSAVPQWEEITYDNFENGWGNFKEAANPSNANDAILMSDASDSTQQAYVKQGNAALRIRGNNGRDSSVFLKKNHDVTGYYQLQVSFWFAPRSMELGEDFVLEYSANGVTGGSWTEVKKYVRGPDDGQTDPGEFYFPDNDDFYFDSVVLDGTIYDLDTTKARIRFRCDASGNGDYVYIDEVKFSGALWEQITFDNFESGWGSFTEVEDNIANDQYAAVRFADPASYQQDYIHEGNAALRLRDNLGEESSVWHKEDHDVTTYANLRVGFWFNTFMVDDEDKLLLEYSSNGGATWDLVKEYIHDPTQVAFSNNDAFFFENGEFYYDAAFLDGTIFNVDTTQARIRFRSVANHALRMFFIDEVSVGGQPRAN